jgi:hypothetical protein
MAGDVGQLAKTGVMVVRLEPNMIVAAETMVDAILVFMSVSLSRERYRRYSSETWQQIHLSQRIL